MNVINNRRRLPRESPRVEVALRTGPYSGRVLDVSDVGLRFELDCPPETDFAAIETVVLGAPGVHVAVKVVWTRCEGTARPICGALVAERARVGWREFLGGL